MSVVELLMLAYVTILFASIFVLPLSVFSFGAKNVNSNNTQSIHEMGTSKFMARGAGFLFK